MGNIIRLFEPKQLVLIGGSDAKNSSTYSAEVGSSSLASSRRSTDEPASSFALSSESKMNTDGMFVPKKRKQSKSPKRKKRSKKYY
jgi:hypothetical protein